MSDQIESKEEEKLAKYFKCELCDYKCDKLATLKKHKKFKHTEHKYKICGEELKSSIELVTHMAK